MPVFGNLADFPLPEVLDLIGYRKGALKIAAEEKGQIIELYIDNHRIRGVKKEGRFLDSFEAHQTLRELLKRSKGLFWFDVDSFLHETSKLNWPIRQIILELGEEDDTVNFFANQLPAPKTWYHLKIAGSIDELPITLSMFFEKARSYLQDGITVEMLAKHLAAPVPQVALYLHKLHLAGFVEPRRAFVEQLPKMVEGSLLSRIWRALTRSRI